MYKLPSFLRSTPLAIISLAVMYVLVARLSLLFMITPGVSPFYPAIGMSFAAVLMLGNRVLPGVFIGAFLIDISSFQPLTGATHPFLTDVLAVTLVALSNVLGVYAGASITKYFCKGEFPLSNSKNVVVLLFSGVFVSCMINSVLAIVALILLNYYASIDIFNVWLTWWMGDSIGLITVLPLMLSWFHKEKPTYKERPILSAVGIALGTLLLCYEVFFHFKNHTYLFLPLMFIASYFFCMRVTTAVICIISLFSFIGLKTGDKFDFNPTIEESFIYFGMFISVLAGSTLTFAGVIAEQRRLTRKMVIDEERYRSIFENMQDVFIQSTIDGVITDVSPSVSDFAHYTKYEIMGLNVKTFYLAPAQRDLFLSKLMKKGKVSNFQTTLKTKSKKELKHVLLNARIIFDEKGNPDHIDTILHDETVRKKHELKIQKQNAQLQTQNKELEQFAYIASHDLQEPLTNLQQFTKLIKEESEDQLTENGRTYLKFITQSTARMQALVRGLLSYSRIGNEKSTVHVDCNSVVNEILQDLNFTIGKNNVQINVGKLPVINGHIGEIRQLFQNLISNAMKFQQKGNTPQIDITAEDTEGGWQISVKDNGIGMDPKDVDKVFVIFKRLHNREDYEGTGIGLALCKKIVERHNGKIWIESALGEGCNFKILLPKKVISS